ncbi:16S rRNA (uracil(1498)-N(3))-methyltransferase [Thiosocius teredinicola]|uniref:16S rRNA (uracil(1498)-N(3))-methyltransferase n=1 Tax=Thiosocius teredinicola TaxID=1973002 RepID=UPI000990F3E5
MRISRIFVEPSLASGHTIELDERAARYAQQVLRLRAGDDLILFDGSGQDFDARLTRCDRKACIAEVGDSRTVDNESPLTVHLAIGISRGERMDLALQKAAELGVGAVTPLATERSVVRLDDERTTKKMQHWQGVIISACEQCGRSRLPSLHAPAPLPAWLEDHPGGFLLHHEAPRSFADVSPPADPQVRLLIGPEGGLSEAERSLAERQGYTSVRMGPRVLRTETAPLAALAAMQLLWGDFR